MKNRCREMTNAFPRWPLSFSSKASSGDARDRNPARHRRSLAWCRRLHGVRLAPSAADQGRKMTSHEPENWIEWETIVLLLIVAVLGVVLGTAAIWIGLR
jgi:hypothetical protein